MDHHRNTNRCTHRPSVLTYAKSLQAAAAGVMSILGCLELDIRRRPRSRFDDCRSSLITIIPETSARARWVASIEERTPLSAAGRRRRLRLGIHSSRFTVRGNHVLVGSCLTESKRGDCAGYEYGCRYAGVERTRSLRPSGPPEMQGGADRERLNDRASAESRIAGSSVPWDVGMHVRARAKVEGHDRPEAPPDERASGTLAWT